MSSRWPSGSKNVITSFGGLTRSALMSLVRSKGNKTTELKMVKLLRREHLSGWRRNADLFGKPDFVWRKKRVAVFIDGCFWHGHLCNRNLTPKTNKAEWLSKIKKNRTRDKQVTGELRDLGWKVIRIWECELTKHPHKCIGKIKKQFSQGYPSKKTSPVQFHDIGK